MKPVACRDGRRATRSNHIKRQSTTGHCFSTPANPAHILPDISAFPLNPHELCKREVSITTEPEMYFHCYLILPLLSGWQTASVTRKPRPSLGHLCEQEKGEGTICNNWFPSTEVRRTAALCQYP